MLTETKRTDLFCEYYAKWITVYKKGAIRKVTMDKYLMTQGWKKNGARYMWKSMLPIRRMEQLDPEKSNLKMVRSTRSTV